MFGYWFVEKYGAEKLWSLLLQGSLDSFLLEQNEKQRYGGWLEQREKLKGLKIATRDDRWNYLANRFGLTVVAQLEEKPGMGISESGTASIVGQMKQHEARIILLDPACDLKVPQGIAGRAGAKVVVAAACTGGEPMASGHLRTIDLALFYLCKVLEPTPH